MNERCTLTSDAQTTPDLPTGTAPREAGDAASLNTHSPQGGAVVPAPMARPMSVNTDVLAIRFVARLVDGLLAIPFLFLFILIPIVGPMLFAIGQTAYFVIAEAKYGGTIGKRVFNLQVRHVDGSPIDARGAFMRNGFLLFGLLPYLGSFFTVLAFFAIGLGIALSSDRRGPHDKLGNACVVRPLAA